MMWFLVTLIITKVALLTVKILGKGAGTSAAGLLALKICPKFLVYAQKYVSGEKITVTGTNGKTTTTSILADIFKYSGKKIVHNDKGANMLVGIANSFVEAISPFKKFDACIIEADEAYLTKLYDSMDFNYLIVTNLSPDQTDRYGSVEAVASKIQDAISKNPNLKLVLNADDPLVAKFGEEREAIYYGFKSKECQYSADLEVQKEQLTVKLNGFSYLVPLFGAYNGYNTLAAIALALECGFSPEQIQNALNSYKPAFGRCQKCKLEGKEATIQLIKNPAGANEVLKTVDKNSHILIGINDNFGDGRDISWLWDTDFEQLKDVVHPIIVTGIRAQDMGKRLKDAGLSDEKIVVIGDLRGAMKEILAVNGAITLLPSYTVLMEITKLYKGII